MAEVDDRLRERGFEGFGAYVRSQRQLAKLSLRQAADLARISNPYLSQIEHGLAVPSVRVITALAAALQVSADTLLLRAAGMAGDDTGGRSVPVEDAIRQDPRLDDVQKHALLAVLASFVGPPSPSANSAGRPRGTAGDGTSSATPAPRRRKKPAAQHPTGGSHDDV